VKLRGRIAGEERAGPLTGRPCVASWTRIAERKPGQPDAKVQDESRWGDLVVRTARGEARIAGASALKLAVDADASGESDHGAAPEVEAFLKAHDHGPEVHDTAAHHYIWYEGLFVAGEEVFVVGRAERGADGALAIVAPEDGHVLLEHVDRERRKRAIPRR
jgi:hypothetical protein